VLEAIKSFMVEENVQPHKKWWLEQRVTFEDVLIELRLVSLRERSSLRLVEHGACRAVNGAFEKLGQYNGTVRVASLPETISRKKVR
jgi:hypothetical protein